MRGDHSLSIRFWVRGFVVLYASLMAAATASATPTFTELYAFTGGPDGAAIDGVFPIGGLLLDRAGNLYGTTYQGGATPPCQFGGGCGVVFKLRPPVPPATQWTYRVLHAFNGNDGYEPESALIFDNKGNLYGTTFYGGTLTPPCGSGPGCGVVFQLAPPVAPSTQWTESVLYVFPTDGSDGSHPVAPLVIDKNGNLYGTTSQGGIGCNSRGCGVVFKLAPPVPPATRWTETVLHSFTGGSDGSGPTGGLTIDRAGNFYGTTPYGGGVGTQGACGVVFKLSPPVPPSTQWTETVLYAFTGALLFSTGTKDGCSPFPGVIADSRGNLYGTAEFGGGGGRANGDPLGNGGVFKLRPDGKEGFWYPFHVTDGLYPTAGLSADSDGNLYGTTLQGGTGCTNHYGCGVVFKLAPDRTETVLYSFGSGAFPPGYPLGANAPYGGVIVDSAGNLFGTTWRSGSAGLGQVYELTP